MSDGGRVEDRWAMARALSLAAGALGRTSPNPAVGAVIVDGNGNVVGEGATRAYGQAHAEPVALAMAGERARDATLYVTLEPCSHHGRTPPCADAIVAAGVARVVASTLDPNPRVAGRGVARLRQAGVPVAVGLGAGVARTLMAGFATWMATRRPHVIAKFAASLDGRIATRTGESRWISGPEARGWAHGVRDHVDAILVGVGTVRADDPALTSRTTGPEHPVAGPAGADGEGQRDRAERHTSSRADYPPTGAHYIAPSHCGGPPAPRQREERQPSWEGQHGVRPSLRPSLRLGEDSLSASAAACAPAGGCPPPDCTPLPGCKLPLAQEGMGADPLLDGITPSRLATHAGASRQPLRVVLDTRLTTPLTSQLVSGNLPGATLVVGVDDGTADWASRRAALTRPGVEVAPVGRGADGRPDPGAVLDLLGARGVTTLLLEGGATIHEAFFRAGLVDRVAAVLAPVVIGGGPSAVGTAATGPDHLAGASRLQDRSVTLVGEDVLVTGWLRRPAWLDDAAPV